MWDRFVAPTPTSPPDGEEALVLMQYRDKMLKNIEIQALISRMSARAVDTLARAVQAIARGDAELGEEAGVEARNVRQMLDEVVSLVAAAPDEPETRAWSATAVLVSRHLERVARGHRIQRAVDPGRRDFGPYWAGPVGSHSEGSR